MSWVKSLASGSEDIFDEDIDEIAVQSKEWKQNMEKRSKVILFIYFFKIRLRKLWL